MYGLKFKTGTSVKTNLKKFNDHKRLLEQEKQFSSNIGKLAGLKEGKKELSKSEKQESIEV